MWNSWTNWLKSVGDDKGAINEITGMKKQSTVAGFFKLYWYETTSVLSFEKIWGGEFYYNDSREDKLEATSISQVKTIVNTVTKQKKEETEKLMMPIRKNF